MSRKVGGVRVWIHTRTAEGVLWQEPGTVSSPGRIRVQGSGDALDE